jgi:hypothetical protein
MKSRSIITLLAMVLFSIAVVAQKPAAQPHTFGITSTDLAVTYTLERAKVQSSACSCFWIKGGSVDGSINFYRGFGIAGNLSAGHANNITPGVNLGKVSYMVGPRYTFDLTRHAQKKYGTRAFGEILIGGVHGFDSIFPGKNETTFSASAFSMQMGAGMDVDLHKGFGLRPFEVDYVRTSLPNNGSNSQNDLRLAFGLSYRLRAH